MLILYPAEPALENEAIKESLEKGERGPLAGTPQRVIREQRSWPAPLR